jgi:hypothetical protein
MSRKLSKKNVPLLLLEDNSILKKLNFLPRIYNTITVRCSLGTVFIIIIVNVINLVNRIVSKFNGFFFSCGPYVFILIYSHGVAAAVENIKIDVDFFASAKYRSMKTLGKEEINNINATVINVCLSCFSELAYRSFRSRENIFKQFAITTAQKVAAHQLLYVVHAYLFVYIYIYINYSGNYE